MKTEHDNPVLLDSILDEALRCVRRGARFETEEYCRRHPELADDLRVMLPALTMLEKPREQAAVSAPVACFATAANPPDLADFEVISEIGRGAMGVVYEAIQKPLGRRVALKVMARAVDSTAKQSLRFQQEAGIAARLHHSNIVPVFEAGESAGFVYYAMQLIEGANLQQLIASRESPQDRRLIGSPGHPASRFDETIVQVGSTEKDYQPVVPKKQPRPAPMAIELSPQSCARIALQVAEGLEFAHARGILHRDIKPSNIMLDHDGRAWIADFGLAKSIEGAGLTATGDVVGTVRYLAPERFQGQSDHRSDIYALGLTLYEALEGKPAYPENDRPRLIARILAGAVPEISVRVPADLATICLKCIQPSPQDRYPTAGELAADLRRFLDGRPIAARRLSHATRALRWCGRNRLIAALLAFIILGASAGLIANWRNSWHLRQVTADSKASAGLASRNHMELLKTVDRFCQTVSQERRVYRSDYRDLRNLLLESANELSTQSAGQPHASESAKIQLASIFQRLGKMRTSEDKLADSEGFLIQATGLLGGLSPGMLEDPAIAIELAATHRQLATVYVQMGKGDSAEGNLQESIRILDQILERDGVTSDANRAAMSELAHAFSVRGDLLFNLRQTQESEVAMNRAIQLWEEVLTEEPEDVNAAFELAVQSTRLGMMLVGNLKRWKEAERPLAEATRHFEFLQTSAPERTDMDFWYAIMLTKKSRWHYMAGQIEEAIATQRSAIAIIDEHHRMFELDLAVKLELGIRLGQLAEFLTVLDQHDPEIFLLLERSEKLLYMAVAGDRDNLSADLALQRTYQTHAEALQRIDQDARALEKVDLAIQILDGVLEVHPGEAIAIEDIHFAAITRAELLTALSRHDDALLEWDQALKFAPVPFVELVKMNRTRTIAWSGKHRQATEQAEAILARQRPGTPQDRHLLSGSAATFAVAAQVVLHEENNPESRAESANYARRAVALLESFLDGGGNLTGVLEAREELRFLADRPDFQALLQPVDAPEG